MKKGVALSQPSFLKSGFCCRWIRRLFRRSPTDMWQIRWQPSWAGGSIFNVYDFVRIGISSECWGRELNRERGVVWDITWLQYATASPQKVTSSIPTSWAGLPSFFSYSVLSCCFRRFFFIILLLYSFSSLLLHFVFLFSIYFFFLFLRKWIY